MNERKRKKNLLGAGGPVVTELCLWGSLAVICPPFFLFYKAFSLRTHLISVVGAMLLPWLERGYLDGYRMLASAECLCR